MTSPLPSRPQVDPDEVKRVANAMTAAALVANPDTRVLLGAALLVVAKVSLEANLPEDKMLMLTSWAYEVAGADSLKHDAREMAEYLGVVKAKARTS